MWSREKNLKKPDPILAGDDGYSIMEIMIAGALLGFIAIAILPAVFSLVDKSKAQGFRATCSSFARAKLQEYISGVAENTAGGFIPTGFEYTKQRFQSQNSQCELSPTTSSPGYRERISDNTIVADDASGEVGQGLQANMQGFQLYVHLRHYNPRILTGGQPTRGCANANYQFFRLGDGIEVTVTGMIRTSPPVGNGGRGGERFGKLEDISGNPNPALTCAVSQVVFPPKVPFRYYLSGDGKIRNMQATISFSAGLGTTQSTREAMESHFRTIWKDPSGNNTVSAPAIANIRSFAVSPDNTSVWVLRPGMLQLYRNCNSNNSVVMSSPGGDITYNGVPDCVAEVPDTAPPNQNTWTGPGGIGIDPNIENIAVDFGARISTDETSVTDADIADDRIFGLYNSGSGGFGTVSASSSANASQIRQFNLSTGLWEVNTATSGSDYFTLPENRPRIRFMFIAQTFPSVTKPVLFFGDNSCYGDPSGTTSASQWVHCVSIFNSSDVNAVSDVRELPLQVEGVSY